MWPYPWSVPPADPSSSSEISQDRWADARLESRRVRKLAPTPRHRTSQRAKRETVIERRRAWNAGR